MNLRLYMRGLGIGILVAAGILILSDTSAAAMTDDEIRAKARTLGMTENVVLSQAAGSEENGPEAEAAAEPSPSPSPTPSPTPSQMPVSLLRDFDDDADDADILANSEDDSDSTEPEPDADPEPADEPDPDIGAEEAFVADTGVRIEIRINSGDDSFRVCSRLEDAGLVETASLYNQYLMDNGYSRSLRVGNHSIPENADYETIALILTGRRT